MKNLLKAIENLSELRELALNFEWFFILVINILNKGI